MSTFDWIEFLDGRAKFSDVTWDRNDPPRETFCLEIDGDELFGEIKDIPVEGCNNFNLEIISFGYRCNGAVGGADNELRVLLTEVQVERAIHLIHELIESGAKMDNPPFVLYQAKEFFLGGVAFKDGWVRIGAELNTKQAWC
jgi:hypothetical protein